MLENFQSLFEISNCDASWEKELSLNEHLPMATSCP